MPLNDHHPRHIVAACALVTNDAGDVMMIRSPKRGWEVPGGQIEQGEALLDGLKREIMEESGITAEIGQLTTVTTRTTDPYIVIFCFLAHYIAGDPRPSEESPEVEWVARDRVLDRIEHPAVYDRVKDMLDYDGQPIYRVYTMNPYTILTERAI